MQQKKRADKLPTQKGLEIGNTYRCAVQCSGDPQGSYTGVPHDSKEKPEQDADDL